MNLSLDYVVAELVRVRSPPKSHDFSDKLVEPKFVGRPGP